MNNTQEGQKEIQQEDCGRNDSLYWSIVSSSGRECFFCKFKLNRTDYSYISAHLEIKRKFWQRGVHLKNAQMVEDFNIILPQVIIDNNHLKLLCEKLKFWQISYQGFDVKISSEKEKGQSLIFSIGKDDGLIYSASKPACIISYSSGSAMRARWAFIVDQSCIRNCSEELSEVLNIKK